MTDARTLLTLTTLLARHDTGQRAKGRDCLSGVQAKGGHLDIGAYLESRMLEKRFGEGLPVVPTRAFQEALGW